MKKTLHETLLEEMNKFAQMAKEQGITLQMPPTSLTEMKGEFIHWEKDRSLKGRFPYDPRFTNPIGSMQGGILCAALDNIWGPLSYTTMAAPCVTIELSTTFISPLLAEDPWYEVEAVITAHTKNMIFMEGRITAAHEHRLVATGKTLCMAKHTRPNR